MMVNASEAADLIDLSTCIVYLGALVVGDVFIAGEQTLLRIIL